MIFDNHKESRNCEDSDEADDPYQGTCHSAGTGNVFPKSAARILSQDASAAPRSEARREDLRPENPSSRSAHSHVPLHVATADVAPVQPGARPLYRPRGPDPLRRLFRCRFPEFQAAYEQRSAPTISRSRLPLIARAASAFRVCGGWSQGIARIAATVLSGIQMPEVRIRPVSSPGRQQIALDVLRGFRPRNSTEYHGSPR